MRESLTSTGVISSTAVITPTQASTTTSANPTTTTQTATAIPSTTPTTSSSSSSSPPNTASTSTGGGQPPFRPTGTSTTATPTLPADYCPTGFYACLAVAGGGCCRTGRDCSTTSCPPPPMTTITTDGATIVVAVSDASKAVSAKPTSTCAGGWYLCPTEAGPVAGCCPSGYACGTASCTLSTSTATATVQKVFPNEGEQVGVGGKGGGAAIFGFVVAVVFLLMM